MFISFVIPVYNSGVLLKKCIESIVDALLSANISDYEIVLVNDCSTSIETKVILDELVGDPSIMIINFFQNCGPAKARNEGVKASRGDWIIFVDSDDILPKNSVALRLALLNHAPEAEWIVGDYIEVHSNRTKVHPKYYNQIVSQGHCFFGNFYKLDSPTKHLVSWGTPPSLCATMIRRSAFEKTGYFNESLRYGEDWYFSLKAGLVLPLFWIAEPIAHVQRTNSSMMTNQKKIGLEIAKASKLAFNDPNLISFKKMLRWRVASDYRWSCNAYLSVDMPVEAISSAIKSIKYSPNDSRNFRKLASCFKAYLAHKINNLWRTQ